MIDHDLIKPDRARPLLPRLRQTRLLEWHLQLPNMLLSAK